ncbi:MAG TPA: hypothetical protein VK808_06170, partial [Bacteroidia bacterium]|nr:hypothetical protein [Bacteroidia bacterium]
NDIIPHAQISFIIQTYMAYTKVACNIPLADLSRLVQIQMKNSSRFITAQRLMTGKNISMVVK